MPRQFLTAHESFFFFFSSGRKERETVSYIIPLPFSLSKGKDLFCSLCSMCRKEKKGFFSLSANESSFFLNISEWTTSTRESDAGRRGRMFREQCQEALRNSFVFMRSVTRQGKQPIGTLQMSSESFRPETTLIFPFFFSQFPKERNKGSASNENGCVSYFRQMKIQRAMSKQQRTLTKAKRRRNRLNQSIEGSAGSSIEDRRH